MALIDTPTFRLLVSGSMASESCGSCVCQAFVYNLYLPSRVKSGNKKDCILISYSMRFHKLPLPSWRAKSSRPVGRLCETIFFKIS